MPQTPTHTGDASPGNRAQPQPDSLENDDRGTKPYQTQSQSQTQRQAADHDKREKNPDFIGDPPPDEDDTIHADDEDGVPPPDKGVVDNIDSPLTTDDNGELGSSSERH